MLYPQEFGIDPLFPSESDFAVVHINDDIGKGVMTYRAFKKGDVVARMAGHKVTDIRQHTLEISEQLHNFDPYFSGYFLHACTPNISLDMKNMLVTALMDIHPNDYLYMDYAETESVLFKQFPCHCGHANCRGWVTGNKEESEGQQVIPLFPRRKIKSGAA